MNICGYLIHDSLGKLVGTPGLNYNYILAANGLFIQAETDLLKATVPIATDRTDNHQPVNVRGLSPIIPGVWLPKGKIPLELFALAVGSLRLGAPDEVYLAITFERGVYKLLAPSQVGSPGRVEYDNLPGKIVDIHSHPGMAPIFSLTDDRDEQGFQLSVVVGHIANKLKMRTAFRVGVYGHFMTCTGTEIFDNAP